MTNQPINSKGETGSKPNRGAPPGLPGWLKVVGTIFIVGLVLVWVIMNVIISPGGHMPLMP